MFLTSECVYNFGTFCFSFTYDPLITFSFVEFCMLLCCCVYPLPDCNHLKCLGNTDFLINVIVCFPYQLRQNVHFGPVKVFCFHLLEQWFSIILESVWSISNFLYQYEKLHLGHNTVFFFINHAMCVSL